MAAPHDDFFHFVFQHARHAAAWLAVVLPGDLAAAVDWNGLRPAPEKLRDHTLRLGIADLVFVATLRSGAAALWIVVEHKAQDDAAVEGQVLRYVVHLRDRNPMAGMPSPAPVAPVVFHHGNAPFRLRQPAWPLLLHGLRPSMRLFVDDCSRIGEPELRRRPTSPLGTLALLCLRSLRHLDGEGSLVALERWSDLLRTVDRDAGPPAGKDAIRAIGEYAMRTVDLPAEELHAKLELILQRREDTIMSTAERLHREGQAKGRVEGRFEGRAEALLRQITKRFGPPTSAVTDRICTAPIADLDRWTDRILDCTSLAALFAD
jgi:hypothetical protein